MSKTYRKDPNHLHRAVRESDLFKQRVVQSKKVKKAKQKLLVEDCLMEYLEDAK